MALRCSQLSSAFTLGLLSAGCWPAFLSPQGKGVPATQASLHSSRSVAGVFKGKSRGFRPPGGRSALFYIAEHSLPLRKVWGGRAVSRDSQRQTAERAELATTCQSAKRRLLFPNAHRLLSRCVQLLQTSATIAPWAGRQARNSTQLGSSVSCLEETRGPKPSRWLGQRHYRGLTAKPLRQNAREGLMQKTDPGVERLRPAPSTQLSLSAPILSAHRSGGLFAVDTLGSREKSWSRF